MIVIKVLGLICHKDLGNNITGRCWEFRTVGALLWFWAAQSQSQRWTMRSRRWSFGVLWRGSLALQSRRHRRSTSRIFGAGPQTQTFPGTFSQILVFRAWRLHSPFLSRWTFWDVSICVVESFVWWWFPESWLRPIWWWRSWSSECCIWLWVPCRWIPRTLSGYRRSWRLGRSQERFCNWGFFYSRPPSPILWCIRCLKILSF